MKDPCRNPALVSSFSFTGIISDVMRTEKTMQVCIHQDVKGKLSTDYTLVIPLAVIPDAELPYSVGDTVLVLDALMYEKSMEMRFRISCMDQIRATNAAPGEINALSFSGKIVDVKAESGYKVVSLEQNVLDIDMFKTTIEFVLEGRISKDMERPPKVGDIGCISHAILYERNGTYRAKIYRPDNYKLLYTPDVVMDLGTIEAKELFI